MSTVLNDLLLAGSIVTTLMIGGVYFTFSGFVMRSLALSGEAGMQVMTVINRVILRSIFMPLFFASTILAACCGIVGVMNLTQLSGWLTVTGSAIFLVGMFGVTAAFNVPLNDRLNQAPPLVWREFLTTWTAWNHLRTVASLVAGILLLISLIG
jgi:uncharacterized membrane protein